MALNATVAWRMRVTGAETNGGGFDPSLTTNMLTDGAATSATGSAPVFSSASYNFVAGDVGAAVYIASGTNWVPGWYPIASVASNVATLAAAIDPLKANAIDPQGNAPLTAGCATTASPTGATFSIDYSWLATAPISASDLTSTASTTATSASGGLHKGMIGNILRQASGTGATTGYYAITNVASATSLTLDRASGTMTAGVFKIGGAHASLLSYATVAGGGAGSPVLTTPLLPGNQIFVRGAGTDTPGSSDYDWSAGYWQTPAGDLTNGSIKFIGYNGRPRISYCGLLFYGSVMWLIRDCMFYMSTASFTLYGVSNGHCSAQNVVFDLAGNDAQAWWSLRSTVIGCLFMNSGGGAAGTVPVVYPGHVRSYISECVFDGVRGPAIGMNGAAMVVNRCIIINGKSDGIHQYANDGTIYGDCVVNCTIDGNLGHGIQMDTGGIGVTTFYNNIISNHSQSGKKGINCADSLAVNLRLSRHLFDYNCWYGNTANFGNWQAAPHDVLIDPQYTNASSKDFSVGRNMQAVGFNSTFRF